MINKKFYRLASVFVFVLLVCALSVYAPSNSRALNPDKNIAIATTIKTPSISHLPTGIWKVSVNGTRGTLNIASVTSNGFVSGIMTLPNQPPNQVMGVYDNSSDKLTFIRIIKPFYPDANQIFTGYQMGSGGEIAGYFEAFPLSGGTAHRTVFGWYGII